MPTRISLTDAIALYSLNELMGQGTSFETYDEVDASTVVVYENDEVVDASFVLNGMVHEEGIAGIVALGNLIVSGSIVDFESDTLSSFVFIRGNLSVVNLVGGCAEILVQGSVTARDVVMGYGGHGRLAIAGDVHAKLVAVDNQSIEVGGEVHADTLGYGYTLPRWDYSEWNEVLSEAATTTLLEKDGTWKCGNESELIAHLLLGRSVLKPLIGQKKF
jgi:hypothetical protein